MKPEGYPCVSIWTYQLLVCHHYLPTMSLFVCPYPYQRVAVCLTTSLLKPSACPLTPHCSPFSGRTMETNPQTAESLGKLGLIFWNFLWWILVCPLVKHGWKIPKLNGGFKEENRLFLWSLFHCHVGLPKGMAKRKRDFGSCWCKKI